MIEKNLQKTRNVKMVVEYDGTDYCGWQTQKNGPSIQSVIERCLVKITGQKVAVTASGRTDSGVHALGQVCNVKAILRMDNRALMMALNSMLPKDISIKSAETAPNGFNARRDAKWKKYRYVIHYSSIPSPLIARTSWRVPAHLDVGSMRKAAAQLAGEHDFSSFMGARSSVKTTVRTVTSLSIRRKGDMLVFEITGNGFLKYMVRNIVGTLVEVGKKRFSADEMSKILKLKDRKKAGPTAPAHGLFLVEVGYE